MQVSFEDWTQNRNVPTLGTNKGAEVLPFQNWRHFKEAFAPEIIEEIVNKVPHKVQTCLDPFGGSGTTALACQFLGINPTTIEVNPYLADLIEAKLSTYQTEGLIKDFSRILKMATSKAVSLKKVYPFLPPTFVEPGKGERYIFNLKVASQIASLKSAIDLVENKKNRRFFRVLLGSTTVPVSNVVIRGKGRRYKKKWQDKQSSAPEVLEEFKKRVEAAIEDILKFGERKCLKYSILRGDSRELLGKIKPVDMAVFSPPYPNSFDYTDVYNVELWMLGYLDNFATNRTLRQSTLASHVQVRRDFSPAPDGSKELKRTLKKLVKVQDNLWDKNIPNMVGGYFADLKAVIEGIGTKLNSGGLIAMVIGDSRYAGVTIRTSKIISEISEEMGLKVIENTPFRSMQSSAQQGGTTDLEENLVVLRN